MIVRFVAVLLLVGALGACSSEDDALQTESTQANAVVNASTAASSQGTYTLVLEWLSGFPRAGDLASARFNFSTPDGLPPEKLEVQQVQLLMPAHSHATQYPPISRVDGAPLNEVSVSGMDFMMSGRWQMAVEAAFNGVVDSAVLLLDVQ